MLEWKVVDVQVWKRCCHGDSGEPGESAFGIVMKKIPAVFSISEIKMNVFNVSITCDVNSRVDAKYRYRKHDVVYHTTVSFLFDLQSLHKLHAKLLYTNIKMGPQLYSIFQKSLSATLDTLIALPDLRARCRAHAQSSHSPVALQHTTHPASMGKRTIFPAK